MLCMQQESSRKEERMVVGAEVGVTAEALGQSARPLLAFAQAKLTLKQLRVGSPNKMGMHFFSAKRKKRPD